MKPEPYTPTPADFAEARRLISNPSTIMPVERAETPVEQRQTRAEGDDSTQNSDAK